MTIRCKLIKNVLRLSKCKRKCAWIIFYYPGWSHVATVIWPCIFAPRFNEKSTNVLKSDVIQLTIRINNFALVRNQRLLFCRIVPMRRLGQRNGRRHVMSPEVQWSEVGGCAVRGRCSLSRKLRMWLWHQAIALSSTVVFSFLETQPYVNVLPCDLLTSVKFSQNSLIDQIHCSTCYIRLLYFLQITHEIVRPTFIW